MTVRQNYLNDLYQFMRALPIRSREKFERQRMSEILNLQYQDSPVVYVNYTSGNDNFPGILPGAPKKTIQAAVDSLPLAYQTAYVVCTADTYVENLVITKPSVGTLYIVSVPTVIASATTAGACYNAASGTTTGWDILTMAGLFTAARVPEQRFVRITWAAGSYEFIKVLKRLNDNTAEIGKGFPVGKVAANYDAKAISLVAAGGIVRPASGPALTICEAPSGSNGSVVLAFMDIQGDTVGLTTVGSPKGIHLVCSNVRSTAASTAAIAIPDEAEINIGFKLTLETGLKTLMGIGFTAGKEGSYLVGGAGGYSFIQAGGNIHTGSVHAASPIIATGGHLKLETGGIELADDITLFGDVMVSQAATVPIRIDGGTLAMSDYSKYPTGIVDFVPAATGNAISMDDESSLIIGEASAITQSHVSVSIQQLGSSKIKMEAPIVASALPTGVVWSISESAEAFIDQFTGPDKDYGAQQVITVNGHKATLRMNRVTLRNTNAGAHGGVSIQNGAKVDVISNANNLMIDVGAEKWFYIGKLGKTAGSGYGAGLYKNDFAVAGAIGADEQLVLVHVWA